MATRPEIGLEYLGYSLNRLRNRGKAIRKIAPNIRIGSLSGFSEYHALKDFLTDAEENFLTTLKLTSGDIVDVGANLGVVCATLSRAYPERRIHAFEPNPSTYRALLDNIQLNRLSQIRPTCLAVGAVDGTVQFRGGDFGRGTASIANHPGENVITVPSVTLDRYLAEHSVDSIALLKVDVEGYEAAVFAGARDSLQTKRISVIYYEVSSEACDRAGTDLMAATAVLLDFGCSIFRIATNGSLEPITLSRRPGHFYENWVAFPR